MRSSVVWAMVVGLLLGCALGVAAMGAVLLPVQFSLEQEQLKAVQLQQEVREQQIINEQEQQQTANELRKTLAEQQRLTRENKQLQLQLQDAVRKYGEAQQIILQKKKP